MFTIEMFPASFGDCLWIEYGDPSQPHRVLIDGGVISAFAPLRERIESLPAAGRTFELLVVTHVDADHIEGAIKLLGALDTLGVSFKDVWFNGYEHLEGNAVPLDALGGVQGEYLSTLIARRARVWNKAFKGKPVQVPEVGDLPAVTLPGGMVLTLLSPTRQALADLLPKWTKEIEKAGLDRENEDEVLSSLESNRSLAPLDVLGGGSEDVDGLAESDFEQDTAEANGSSIAVLAEYAGKRAILTGDAFPNTLAASLERLGATPTTRLRVEALKVPHHGSSGNLSRDLLELLRCSDYLVSTNGKRYGHPDRESIARIVRFGGPNPRIHFNYRTDINAFWDSKPRGQKRDYQARYPRQDEEGFMKVTL